MGIRQGISFTERKAEVAQHFRHVHKVCPYSGAAVIKDEIAYADLSHGAVGEIGSHTEMLRAEIEKLLNDPGKKMLFFLMDEAFSTHDEAHMAAKQLFVELSLVGHIIGNSPILRSPNFKAKYRALFDLELNDPRMRFEGPSFGCSFDEDGNPNEDKALFNMAMNPLYQPSHPRYSPHPALTVTKISALNEVTDRDPNVRRSISRRALLGIAQSLYPKRAEEELLRSYEVHGAGEVDRIETVFHEGLDENLILRAFANYDKGLYIYPPETQPSQT